MSKVIDERVVSMEFDNRHFEKNVATTMNTLDELQNKLKFDGATKGLEEVSSASKKVDMDTLGKNVDSVRVKFSSLQTVAVTALANITNSAMNTGKQLLKSLTVDQLTSGWNKYEQKTASVQTIMNSTGLTIDEVSSYLNKLMWYSDETSYSFSDMTASLAQLTSAGGDIEKLIPMIEGIANATAFAGKGSAEFSRSIYNLNQSYSAGYLQYMDWRSLQNAGVTSKQLMETLIATAEELGKIEKGQISISNFGETLKDKWADTEVMEKAFGKFSELTEAAYAAVEAGKYDTAAEAIEALSGQYNDLAVKAFRSAQEAKSFTEAIEATKDAVSSGWMKTSEIIFGDYEQAKKLWTGLANTLWDVFASGAERRNELLEQTLGSGWKQLMNAGVMDDAGYKNWIRGVLETEGKSLDEMIEKYGTLEDALREGLLSGDITDGHLKEALNGLTKEYLGYSDAQLRVSGFSKDQVEALRELNDQIQNGSISISDFSDKLKKLSGRELIIQSFKNMWEALLSVINPIKQAFTDIFPPATAEKLYNIIEGFANFTEKLKLTEKQSENLRRTFRGLFAIIDIVWTITKAVTKGIFKIIGAITGAGDGILSVTGSIGDLLTRFRDFIKGTNTVEDAVDGVVSVIVKAIEAIKKFNKKIKESFESKGFQGFFDFLKKIWTLITNIFNKLVSFISGAIDAIVNAFGGFNFDTLLKIFDTGILVAIAYFIKRLVDVVKEGNLIKWFNNLKEIVDIFTDTFGEFQNRIKSEVIKNIATSIAILVASLVVLTLIDKEKLNDALVAIVTLLGSLMGSSALFGKISETMTMKDIGKAQLLNKLAWTLLILSFALTKLSKLSWDEMARGLVAMNGALLTLIGSLAILSRIKSTRKMATEGPGQLFKLTLVLIPLSIILKSLSKLTWDEIGRGVAAMNGVLLTLAGSIFILSRIKGEIQPGMMNKLLIVSGIMTILGVNLTILSKLSWGGIARGLVAMNGVILTLSASIAILSQVDKLEVSNKTVGQMVALAATMLLLSISLKSLGKMSWEEIARGIVAMNAALLSLVGTLAIMSRISSTKKMSSKGSLQLLAITGVLTLLVIPLKSLGNMSWSSIGKGIVAMNGALLTLVGTLAIVATISSRKKMATQGTGQLAAMAGVLLLVSFSLKALAKMGWEEIGKGLIAMGGALAILAGVLAIISRLSAGGQLAAGAASMLLLSAALGVLVPTLFLLGKMEVKTIAQGLITIAAALTILGIAGMVLKNCAPALVSVAGSLALIGAACILVGSGAILLSAGLGMLAKVIIQCGDALVNFIVNLTKGLTSLLPFITEMVMEAIIILSKGLIKGAPVIAEAIVAVLVATTDALVTAIPKLAEGLLKIIHGLLVEIGKYLPLIVEEVVKIIIKLLDLIAQYVPVIVEKLVDITLQVFVGFANALKGIDVDVLKEGLKGMLVVAALLAVLGIIAALVPAAFLGVIGLAIIVAELAGVLAALGALYRIDGLSEAISDGGKLLSSIGNAIGNFIGGLAGGFAEGFSKSLPNIGSDLSAFMTNLTPFLEGLKSIDESMLSKGKLLVSLILMLTATNMIDAITSWLTGGAGMAKFAMDLAIFGKGMKMFADEVAGINPEEITAAAEAGKNLGKMAKAIPTEGGLWDLLAGKNDLKKFSDNLPLLGEGIKAFADKVEGLNGETVKAAAEAGVSLAKMAKAIPTDGGLWDLLAGKNDMSLFATQISEFGDALKLFSNVSADINTENIDKGVKAGTAVANMASKLPMSGGLWQVLNGSVNMNTFSAQLLVFASAVKNFADKMKEVGDISGITAKLNELNAALSAFSVSGLNGFINSFRMSKINVSVAMTEMLDAAIKVVKNKTSGFESAAKKMMKKFLDAIKGYKPKVKDAFKEIVTETISSVKTDINYNRFYNAGKYLVQGFAAGISEHTFRAKDKAIAMAQAAAEAAAEALDEHSPSKVGYGIGDYFGVAFVNAISDHIDNAYNAGSDMADSAKSGLTQVLNGIQDLIVNGIDNQPVITPILNLDEMANGVGIMNSMFGMSPSVGVMARVNSIGSSMNKNQNGVSNADVISAIKDLKNTINNTSNNTYNINGITYDNGSEISNAVETLIRAAKIERRR